MWIECSRFAYYFGKLGNKVKELPLDLLMPSLFVSSCVRCSITSISAKRNSVNEIKNVLKWRIG